MRIDTSTPENLHVTLSPHMFWPSDMQDPCRGLLGRLAPRVWVPDMHNLWGGHHQIQIRISPCVWTSDARSPQRASKDKHNSQWASDTLDLCTRFACPDKIRMPPQVWTPDTAGIPMGLLAAKPESKFCRTFGRLTGRISAKDRFRWTSSGYSTPATIRKKMLEVVGELLEIDQLHVHA